MSLLATGQGVKNLAIGVAIFAGLVGLVLVLRKGQQVVAAVNEGAGFVFGYNEKQTLGTWLYDQLHSDVQQSDPVLAKWGIKDETQAIATCNALWSQNGELKGEVCLYLRDQGKLSQP